MEKVVNSGMTDEELVLACQRDMQFLEELIHRYEGKLGAYIGRKSHANRDDIKDILQNIFIKVYKNINDFDPALKFSSWVYRIAHNEMIDWYRREKSKPRIYLDDIEGIWKDITDGKSMMEDSIKNEQKEHIRKIVDELDDKYKEIVELRYLEEKSYEEIADILTLPPGTVSIRLSRVKKILQEKLAELK